MTRRQGGETDATITASDHSATASWTRARVTGTGAPTWPRGVLWPTLDDFYRYQGLRLVEYACVVLASHEPGLDDPGLCAVCRKPWRCPLAMWAADWILTAQGLGLFTEYGISAGDTLAGAIQRLPDTAGPVSTLATQLGREVAPADGYGASGDG